MSDEQLILAEKTVLVSGVGPGLGSEVCERVLRDGGKLVIGARNAEKLEGIAKELDASGEKVLAHPFDITNEDDCTRIVAASEERFGRLDAMVQVAALEPMGDLGSTTAEDFRNATEVNVVGSIQLLKACVPAMERAGGGSIVLIGSQVVALPPPTPQLAYAASKAALLSASLQLASELGPKRIRVNTVIPTWMWGPPVEGYIQWQAGKRGVSPEEVKGEIEALFPIGEIPADDDVAEVIVLFCSDRMRMVTGQYLRVDGGQKMNL